MKFSIIIPAYNEEHYIGRTLDALHTQTVPRHEFEIIVVDNNSEDATNVCAQTHGADKVIHEARRGTNFARQRGFEESKGAIVVFLDADCIPPPHWLMTIETLLTGNKVAAVSGPYDYGFQGMKEYMRILYGQLLFSKLDKILYFFFHKKAGAVMGGNFATNRETIEKMGGLPPRTFYGDDAAIAILISRKVGRVLFTPHICVKSSPRRFQKEGLCRTTVRYAHHYLKTYFTLPS